MAAGIKPSEKRRVRRAVYRRDSFMCVDCKEFFYHPRHWRGEHIEGLTLGHINPRSKGGSWRIDNLVTQCIKDNKDLGDRPWIPNWRDVYAVPETEQR